MIGLLMDAQANGYQVALTSVQSLISGPYAPLFFIGFLVVGLVVPALIELAGAVFNRFSERSALMLALGIGIGGFVLRYCIVAVGMHPQVWAVVS